MLAHSERASDQVVESPDPLLGAGRLRPGAGFHAEHSLIIVEVPCRDAAQPSARCGQKLRQTVEVIYCRGEAKEVAGRRSEADLIRDVVPKSNDAILQLARFVWDTTVSVTKVVRAHDKLEPLQSCKEMIVGNPLRQCMTMSAGVVWMVSTISTAALCLDMRAS